MGIMSSIGSFVSSISNYGRSGRRDRMSEVQAPQTKKRSVVVGATHETDETTIQSFDNSNVSFDGNLKGFDYTSVLRDKQGKIFDIYRLADYYVDADPLCHGIVKHVYVPYSVCSPWVLGGANEKTCRIYQAEYDRIRLREKMDNIFLEYWKYGNVFVYWLNGNIITLPPHKCRIGNVAMNGQPIVDFNCQGIYNEWKQKGYSVRQNWVKDNSLQTFFSGFPPEVQQGINKAAQYVQLNPQNCHVMQGSKESWQRYAIPFITSCLMPLAKKELISNYQNALLNLGIRSFVHVTYGDSGKGNDILPDASQLRAVRSVFSKAMSGFPLAVTNHMAKATVLQPDTSDLFQWDNYKNVNSDILSAGGISGILVTGNSEDGSTFASAQVSMQTAAARIDAARDEFCDLMNKINERIYNDLSGKGKYNIKTIPTFKFLPLDMTGKKSLRETCTDLWQKGLVSTKTMMETNGYSLQKQFELRKQESKNETDTVMIPRSDKPTSVNENTEDGEGAGRPKLEQDERTSDESKAQTGKQPKPSNPQGSMDE